MYRDTARATESYRDIASLAAPLQESCNFLKIWTWLEVKKYFLGSESVRIWSDIRSWKQCFRSEVWFRNEFGASDLRPLQICNHLQIWAHHSRIYADLGSDLSLPSNFEVIQISAKLKIEAMASEMSTADFCDCPLISVQACEDPDFHSGSDFK